MDCTHWERPFLVKAGLFCFLDGCHLVILNEMALVQHDPYDNGRELAEEMLRAKVEQFIVEHRLFREGDTVVVAVSGGADSVALLDILVSLADLRLRLVVAHLNHTLRGDESDADEEFVRQRAIHYGLPAEISRVDVKGLSRQKKLSLEEAGRVARYDFLAAVARNYGSAAIGLAHHADDQAETVLLRLLRGAGASGLCAMSPKSGANLVRPLLAVKRQEIEVYLRERGISYRHDSTNSDREFLRNRVRHELLPYLETYNPAVRERLVATAQALARDEEVLEEETDTAFARCTRGRLDAVAFHLPAIASEPAGIRYRLYRRALLLAKGGLERIAVAHLQAIDRMIRAGRKPHATLSLPDGMMVARSYDTLTFLPVPDGLASTATETEIDGPGVHVLPGGVRLEVGAALPPAPWEGLSPGSACFDADAAPFPWLVRAFMPGDRIVPLGMTGHKKVKDLFIDEKVPRKKRQRLPLIFSGGKLLWVATLRVSAEAAVTGQTRKAVQVRILDMDSLMDL